jgi:aminoglycoside phosphotransferase (APT) family kinase protein
MSSNMPAAEVDIDAALVHRLLQAQHPDLAHLPITPLAFGWDNAIFRLGDDWVVHIPRRQMVADLVRGLHRWLPALAPTLPLPIPVPVRTGEPDDGFPWPWSVCAYLPGAPALDAPPADPEAAAVVLGSFVAALRRPAPPDAPLNPYRGVPLAERDPAMRGWVAQLGSLIDGPAVLRYWDARLTVPPWSEPPQWLHGDLHPGNVLVHDGRLSAVIDFIDLTGGDPATDLIAAWMFFPAELRPVFRAAAGDIDRDTWARAEGWALSFAVAVLANSADNPPYAALGQRTLDAVLHA